MKYFNLFVFTLVFVTADSQLPIFVEQCYRNDPDLSLCIKRNMEHLKTQYSKGIIPELGIIALNPAVIPSITYNESGLFYDLKNLGVFYLDNMTINSVDFNTDSFNLNLYFETLRFEGAYKLSGKLLDIQLDAEGNTAGNLTKVRTSHDIKLKTITINGIKYLTVVSSKVKLAFEKYEAYFENLVKDDKELNDKSNKVINENQEKMIQQFTPFFEKILNYYFESTLKFVFGKYPLDVLLPVKIASLTK